MFAIAISLGFYLHKLALDRMISVEAGQQRVSDKVSSFGKKLNDYQNVLDNFDSQFKKYVESLKKLEDALGQDEARKNDIISNIENVKKDIEELHAAYGSTISEFQVRIKNLEEKLAAIKAPDAKVQLGEIEVEKKKQD
ncbi:MAG: hypothetical protein PHQ96_07570 [Candidatus Omnitrophica bacterium]|nr:hypothetical protein [Candidatus Omnitrophota bacterium]